MVVVCEVHMMLAVARLMVVSLSCEAKTSVNFAPRKNKRLRNVFGSVGGICLRLLGCSRLAVAWMACSRLRWRSWIE